MVANVKNGLTALFFLPHEDGAETDGQVTGVHLVLLLPRRNFDQMLGNVTEQDLILLAADAPKKIGIAEVP